MRSEYGFIKRKHPEEDIKSEEHDQSETINKLNIELNSLQQKIEAYQRREADMLYHKEKLVKLYDKGVVDSDREERYHNSKDNQL